MVTPKISVVMSVYNGIKHLEEAVESILNQSFGDFEFIIIDDGSTDGSSELLKRFARQDPRIKLISRENRGLVASLNEGIEKARAEIIARMDADDISLSDRFAVQYDFLAKNPNVVCVGSYSIIIDEDGDELTCLQTPLTHEDIDDLLVQGHCPMEHPVVMFRAAPVKKLGLYSTEYVNAQDYDLWLRLSEIGQLANLPLPLIKYRFLSSSESGSNQVAQADCVRRAHASMNQRRGLNASCNYKQWRPSSDAKSQFSHSLKLGWWAYNYGNKSASMKYGVRAICNSPLKLSAWVLLLKSFTAKNSWNLFLVKTKDCLRFFSSK